MKLLTSKQQESYEKAKNFYICWENFEDKYANDKKYPKVRDQCYYIGEYREATHIICNLKYSIPKEINYCSFS